MRKVELRQAYAWECPDCGSEQFARAVTAELTDEQREDAYRKIHDLEPWSELPENWSHFLLVGIPRVVKCYCCSARFSTADEDIGGDNLHYFPEDF